MALVERGRVQRLLGIGRPRGPLIRVSYLGQLRGVTMAVRLHGLLFALIRRSSSPLDKSFRNDHTAAARVKPDVWREERQSASGRPCMARRSAAVVKDRSPLTNDSPSLGRPQGSEQCCRSCFDRAKVEQRACCLSFCKSWQHSCVASNGCHRCSVPGRSRQPSRA